MISTVLQVNVNNIACYGPQYICECKRHLKNRLLGTLATEHISSVLFSATTMGRLTHWPTSTLAKVSLLITNQSKSAQLVIRFVGRFMSLL